MVFSDSTKYPKTKKKILDTLIDNASNIKVTELSTCINNDGLYSSAYYDHSYICKQVIVIENIM